MGFMGDMFGVGGGSGGLNYKAQGADLIQGANAEQANQAYQNTQTGLQQQQDFLKALQAQNGIGNQSQVFQQQQALAQQLQDAANGGGPNPAMAQLNNATGANVANQAALMASQRGAGANAGLMARQAAMQGGALQQNAVGQAAAMNAQQQIAARQQLQAQQGMMGNLAGQQVGQQGSAVAGYNQFAQGQQQNILNAIGNYNNAQVGQQGNLNNVNSGMQQAKAGAQRQLAGQVVGGAANAGQFAMMAAEGGMIPDNHITHYLDNYAQGGAVNFQDGGKVGGQQVVKTNMNNYANDTVAAKLSPGEVVIPLEVMKSADPVSAAARFVQAVLAKQGMKKNG